jgi:integrase
MSTVARLQNTCAHRQSIGNDTSRPTRSTSEQRINQHVVPELGGMELRRIDRVVLQDLLDRKAAAGVSFGVVTHLRFDLRQIFKVAVADGFIERSPAQLLFTPQSATRGIRRKAEADQIAGAFAAMDLRERLILKLAGIAGMRPGEIFGLKWATLEPPYADVRQRVYPGRDRLSEVHNVNSSRGVKRERNIRYCALAGDVSHAPRWLGISVRDDQDSAPSRKLLAAAYRAKTPGRWLGVDQLSGASAQLLFTDER